MTPAWNVLKPLGGLTDGRLRGLCGWLLLASAAALLCWRGSELDLLVSRQFFDGQRFVGNQFPLVQWVYWAVPWFGRAVGLAGLAVLWWQWRQRRRPIEHRPATWVWTSRRLVTLACMMALGVGGVVNFALKSHSGRPRPVDTLQFGGGARFQPALSFEGPCTRNCSFVSGHAATGFALMAWGLGGSLATRRRWLWRGLLLGALVGAGRVMQGGHYLSDVLFAAIFIGLTCWLQRAAWVHWRAWRRTRRDARPAAGRATGPLQEQGH